MQKTTGIGLLAIVILIVGIGVMIVMTGTPAPRSGSIEQATVFQTSVASTTVPVAGVTNVLSARSGRLGFRLTNTGLFALNCTLNSTSTAANLTGTGIVLAPTASSTGDTHFDSRENRIDYDSDIFCKATTGTSTISTTEYLDR